VALDGRFYEFAKDFRKTKAWIVTHIQSLTYGTLNVAYKDYKLDDGHDRKTCERWPVDSMPVKKLQWAKMK